MSWRRVATIFRKDLKDAIRDARVLVALVVPLAFGLFYSFAFDDDTGTVEAKVAYFSPDLTRFPDFLAAVAGEAVEVTFFQAEDARRVRDEVTGDHADLGLILPPGFDAAVQNGEAPRLEIVHPGGAAFESDYLLATIEPALRAMRGDSPPAALALSIAEPDPSESAIETVGIRTWAVLAAVVMMIGMIAMLAIPVILAEETEKKTLDALVLIASYGEVIVAKSALGVFYIAVMVPFMIALTGQTPVRWALFTGATALLGIALIGLGLLIAGLFKNANQLNTWSGFFLLPVLGPAFAIGLPAPDAVERVVELLPSGAAMKLLMESASDERLFGGSAVSFAVIVVWAVVAYALLLWQLSRRQA
jgi:ABC-2 type transport system permease protein